MAADQYTKTVLTVIALGVTLIATHLWWPSAALDVTGPVHVEAATATPKYEVVVPRSWGRLVAYSNGNLLLETSDGNMRVVDVEGQPPQYPKVKALIRWE